MGGEQFHHFLCGMRQSLRRAGAWLLALACLGLFACRTADARTLRVLTYNIHHSEGRDGAFDLARLANVINAANPDLVALQELDQGNERSGMGVFQLDQLAQLTGMQGFFGKTIDYRGGAYGNGVLVRSDLHVTGVVTRPMPSPADGEGRGLMEVGVSFDGGQAPDFKFYATHLSAGDTEESSRMAQAALINSLVETSDAPALVGGDFNARPLSPVMQRIGQQWKDSTAQAAGSQIDYVWYRGVGSWNVVEAGIFLVNPTTRIASDHFPYLTVVEFVPEPSAMAMVGSCAGLIVVLRSHATCGAPCGNGQSSRTPPGAKGGLGGRSPAAQAAFWGLRPAAGEAAAAAGGRRLCEVRTCRGVAGGQHKSLRGRAVRLRDFHCESH